MNPYAQRQMSATATRIDLLLALYDGAIERIAVAITELRNGDRVKALAHVGRAQLIVSELAAGVRPELAPDMGSNILRLYEYVVHQLAQADVGSLESALKTLATLREGFDAIRPEATHLERSGEIPPPEENQVVVSLA